MIVTPKKPTSTKWYWFDWSADELGDGVAITSINVDVEPGITKDEQTFSGQRVGLRLSGGVAGKTYVVDLTINTSANESLTQQIKIPVNQKGH